MTEVDRISAREIEVASSTDLVVTYKTVASTELEEGHEVVFREERLVGNDITERKCREETEALSLCKVFRSVICHVGLEHIACVIVICHTCRSTDEAAWSVEAVTWHSVLGRASEKESSDRMLAEVALIVDSCVSIEVAHSAPRA